MTTDGTTPMTDTRSRRYWTRAFAMFGAMTGYVRPTVMAAFTGCDR